MTQWWYDQEVEAADIRIGSYHGPVRTFDLETTHVLIDFDLDGNPVSIELLGDRKNPMLAKLQAFLKEPPNRADER